MKKINLFFIILPVIISCSAVDLSTDEAAMSYLIAYDFVHSQSFNVKDLKIITKAVKDFPEKNSADAGYTSCFKHLEELKKNNIIINKKCYLKGFEDSLKGKKSEINTERSGLIRNKYYNIISSQRTVTTEEFKKFLQNDKSLTRTKTGLFYKIIKRGEGKMPGISDRITAHMIGRLPNGYEFSNTYLRQAPVQFYVKTTVKGIIEGLQLMKTGSRFLFYIPPELAYGDKQKGIIPANSYIVYELELLEVKTRN